MGSELEQAPAAAAPQIAVPAGQVTGPNMPAPKADADGGLLGTLGDFGHGLMQEGIGGLFDMSGMMDRQEAQRELKGNFKIVDPGTATTAGNQITEEEFEKTAKLYSDIRLDRTHMHFDLGGGTSPLTSEKDQDQYKRDFMGNVGRILQTTDGRELVDGVANNPLGHDMKIQNILTPGSSQCEGTNSDAAGDGHTGSDTVLSLKPGANDTVGRAPDPWRQERSDVQMFHELTHAYHEMRGTDDQSPDPEIGKGLNGSERDLNAGTHPWEMQAVGIGNHAHDSTPNENKYRADRAQIGASGYGSVSGDAGMPQRGDYTD